MFIESPKDAKNLLELLQRNSSVIYVYYQFDGTHSINNIPLVACVQVLDKNYVISLGHPDSIVMPIEFLKLIFKTKATKIIFDRKKLKYHIPDIVNAVDALVYCYLNKKTEIDSAITSYKYTDLRSVPIMMILNHFKQVCKSINKTEFNQISLKEYEEQFSNALFEVEKNGMYVENFNLGEKTLVNSDNLVFGQYNMLTPTGRPSNSFGNVNYVALNKKTGQRDCFKSRFGNEGLLVMIDYESYHLRLVGNHLDFDLPNISLHEYLGKIYHDKDELTEEEYELSKKITFNLMYGGIDDDIKNNVPFMKVISEYVDKVFNQYIKYGYVQTWFFNRKISSCFLGESPNPYKVFNYLLQAAETERNCDIISKINKHLDNTDTKLVLYTYDAFLFDVPSKDFDLLKEVYPTITTNGKYPVRTYIGNNYGSLRQI